MKTLFLPLLLLLVLGVTGCKEVTVDKPFGEKPAAITAEDWDGTWVTGNGALTLKVSDGPKGLLRAAWVETKDGDFELATRDLFVRTVNRSLFVTMADRDEDGKTNFVWARAIMKPDELQLWAPVFDEIKRLAEQGKLPATISSNRIALRNLNTEHLNRIERSTDAQLFDVEHPLKLRRLKND